MKGYYTLKEAAEYHNASVSCMRFHVAQGTFGEETRGYIRMPGGKIFIKAESILNYKSPWNKRGAKRKHLEKTIRVLEKIIEDPQKREYLVAEIRQVIAEYL